MQKEEDEKIKQEVIKNLDSPDGVQSSLDAFLHELQIYSNKQHTPEEIKAELREELEKNYQEFDAQMLDFMMTVRKEMDWLDSKHLFLAPKDIFVFFGRLD